MRWWHFTAAVGWIPVPSSGPTAQTVALGEAGARGDVKPPASQTPPWDAPKGPGGDEVPGEMGSRRWALQDVGGQREGLDPDKAIFCHEKGKRCLWSLDYIYVCFSPCSNWRIEIKY